MQHLAAQRRWRQASAAPAALPGSGAPVALLDGHDRRGASHGAPPRWCAARRRCADTDVVAAPCGRSCRAGPSTHATSPAAEAGGAAASARAPASGRSAPADANADAAPPHPFGPAGAAQAGSPDESTQPAAAAWRPPGAHALLVGQLAAREAQHADARPGSPGSHPVAVSTSPSCASRLPSPEPGAAGAGSARGRPDAGAAASPSPEQRAGAGQAQPRPPPSPAERHASWRAARSGGLRLDPATLPAAGRPSGPPSARRPGSASPGGRRSVGASPSRSSQQGSSPHSSAGGYVGKPLSTTPTRAGAPRRAGAAASRGSSPCGEYLLARQDATGGTPVRAAAPGGGPFGGGRARLRSPSPMPGAAAAASDPGPEWLVALLADAAREAAQPSAALRAPAAAEAASEGGAAPRPGMRRRWELPGAGEALVLHGNAGDAPEPLAFAQRGWAAGDALRLADSGAAADAVLEGVGGRGSCADDAQSEHADARPDPAGAEDKARDGDGGGAWVPLSQAVDACVLAGVRMQYACASRACLGRAPVPLQGPADALCWPCEHACTQMIIMCGPACLFFSGPQRTSPGTAR